MQVHGIYQDLISTTPNKFLILPRLRRQTYNHLQKILEKLRKLRKGCNHNEALTEYKIRSCTASTSKNCRV